MSDDKSAAPEVPADLPATVVSALDECSAPTLEVLAEYAEALATHRRQQDVERKETEIDNQPESDGQPDRQNHADRPDGVPAKASTTVKEINGNRYQYWQWRDGEKIRSQYKGPVEEET